MGLVKFIGDGVEFLLELVVGEQGVGDGLAEGSAGEYVGGVMDAGDDAVPADLPAAGEQGGALIGDDFGEQLGEEHASGGVAGGIAGVGFAGDGGFDAIIDDAGALAVEMGFGELGEILGIGFGVIEQLGGIGAFVGVEGWAEHIGEGEDGEFGFAVCAGDFGFGAGFLNG